MIKLSTLIISNLWIESEVNAFGCTSLADCPGSREMLLLIKSGIVESWCNILALYCRLSVYVNF
jgi:hypothetical protein